jgi:hypothetical protein
VNNFTSRSLRNGRGHWTRADAPKQTVKDHLPIQGADNGRFRGN